jgi:hypothetical protein
MIFGMPLLRGYYVVHDVVKSQIGFVPAADSTKRPLIPGESPAARIGGKFEASPTHLYSWLIVVAIIIVFLLVYFLAI